MLVCTCTYSFLMKNLTINRLTLLGLFDAPVLSNVPSLSARKLNIQNSFHHFIYNSQKTKISNSNFRYFQDSVICYESKVYRITGQKTAHISTPGYGQEIHIIDATFYNCISKHDGGAISHFSPDEGDLIVKSSTFAKCKAAKYPGDGGAIYFSGNSSLIDRVCCIECQAARDGHFVSIVIRGENGNDNQLNNTVVFGCKNESATTGWQTTFLDNGRIVSYYFNTTECSTSLQSSVFQMHSLYGNVLIRYATIRKCQGPWSVFGYGTTTGIMRNSNIIKNVAIGNKYGIFYYYKNFEVQSSVLIGNKGNIVSPKSPDSFIKILNCRLDKEIPSNIGILQEGNKIVTNTLYREIFTPFIPTDCKNPTHFLHKMDKTNTAKWSLKTDRTDSQKSKKGYEP